MHVPTALLVCRHNLGEWYRNAEKAPLPGGSLPYGLQNLRRDFSLIWSDGQVNGMWRRRIPQRLGYTARAGSPGLAGSLAACYATPRLRHADVVLSVFENVGLGFARSQSFRSGVNRLTPHVMLTCWLAENCQTMSSSQLRSVRRSLQFVSRAVVFSANQVSILHNLLGLDPERIAVVPFGVDTNYYDPAVATGPSGGSGVIAVGVDSRRDYRTLLDAVGIARVPLTLACDRRKIAGLSLPSNVKILSKIPHDEYRRLLLAADLVVTPTVAPAYPSGQSVVLEAMAMGKATLTTDSEAMREYVTNGSDGILVPPRAPAAMAEMIITLLADKDRLHAMGTMAAKTVRERFDLENLWQGVSGLMMAACRKHGI